MLLLSATLAAAAAAVAAGASAFTGTAASACGAEPISIWVQPARRGGYGKFWLRASNGGDGPRQHKRPGQQ
jgi:hypothetical protein